MACLAGALLLSGLTARLADLSPPALASAAMPRARPAPRHNAPARVPRGVRVVTVTVTGVGSAQTRATATRIARRSSNSTVVLRSPRKVRRAIHLADALTSPRPGQFFCPMIMRRFGLLSVTYSAGPAGPALARAQLSLAGPGAPGSRCDPIGFWARGHAQKPLVGANFAQAISRLSGLSLNPVALAR